jgi:hypothetical protein
LFCHFEFEHVAATQIEVSIVCMKRSVSTRYVPS